MTRLIFPGAGMPWEIEARGKSSADPLGASLSVNERRNCSRRGIKHSMSMTPNLRSKKTDVYSLKEANGIIERRVASVSKVERKSPAQSRGWKATAAKNGISVPRRLYADFCNKIGAKRTFVEN